MAEFIQQCPYCSGDLQMQDEWLGMEVSCPMCQSNLVVTKTVLNSSPIVAEVVPNAQADEKTCPFCGGTIKAQAILCKHCRQNIPPLQAKFRNIKKSPSKLQNKENWYNSENFISFLWWMSGIAYIVACFILRIWRKNESIILAIVGVVLAIIGVALSILAFVLTKTRKKFELLENESIISTCHLMDEYGSFPSTTYYVRMTNKRLILCAIRYPLLPDLFKMFMKPKHITFEWRWEEIATIGMKSVKEFIGSGEHFVIEIKNGEEYFFRKNDKLIEFWEAIRIGCNNKTNIE